MINTVSLGGKIVSDIELRKSKTGLSVIDFRLMFKSAKTKFPLFIDIEVWGNEAEKLASRAKRGDFVVCNGELRRDVWEKDGEERSKIKVTANRAMLVTEKAAQPEPEPIQEPVDDDKAF